MSVGAEKLLEILEDGMPPEAVDALHNAVAQGNRRAARRIILKEAPFRPTECATLYEHLVEKLAGSDVRDTQ